MAGMTDTRSTVDLLRTDIERAGYYPQIVTDGVRAMLGHEPVLDHLVHHEATFDSELRRHLTVLVLTPSRLIFGHTDEHPAESGEAPSATTTAEAVGLRNVRSVVLTRMVENAPAYAEDPEVQEVVLTIGWGAISRIDLEPAACEDPDCEGDHGYTGTVTADDFVLRVSAAAEGSDLVTSTQRFGAAVSTATAQLAP
jgi:hypothetical protein